MKKIFKKLKITAVVFGAIIMIGVISSLGDKDNQSTKEGENQVNNNIKTEAVNTPEVKKSNNEVSSVLSENSEENLFKVIRVVDGDTIAIEGGQVIRYIGIDTPETVHPSKPIQCFGKEASNKNKELVEGKMVKLEKDVSETDKYGRLVRYVWVGDIFVNDYLVRNGYAYAYTYPPDVKYSEQFVKAQAEAKLNNRGLWASCQDTITDTETKVEPTPTPVPAPNKDVICTNNAYNCDDFSSHAEAQSVYDYCLSLGKGDIHRLDADSDGLACESLK